ncbi:MAG: hypothetical protein IJ131_00905 [Eggerthellaceae bacterium]|nr:hypothetical protein [Eggerthellaceae bacterium]
MGTDANIYSYSRVAAAERFSFVLDGDLDAFFLVTADSSLGDAGRKALSASAAALGWPEPTFLFVDGPSSLSKAEYYEAVEALDPLVVAIVGASARKLAFEAYACEIPDQKRFRLFGRDACCFADLDGLVLSEAGKRNVWALLKTLPHGPLAAQSR